MYIYVIKYFFYSESIITRIDSLHSPSTLDLNDKNKNVDDSDDDDDGV